jgi:AcrR family transcriptional regulator
VTTRTGNLDQQDFIRAGTEFVDKHGLQALTMRALGVKLGVDATACYRHFTSKDELLSAMVDAMLAAALDSIEAPPVSPREGIIDHLLAVRRAFLKHPHLAATLVMSTGDLPSARRLTLNGIELLRSMGLEGDELVRCYQTVESYTMGSCVFDMSGTPDNMEIRRLRYRSLGVKEFTDVARTMKGVSSVTEAAFQAGINAIIDSFSPR